MNAGVITFWLVELIAGIYMLGVGFKFISNPGKKGSNKNEEHFNKFRGVFKLGGIFTILHVLLSGVAALA